jgi:hypothetical protein
MKIIYILLLAIGRAELSGAMLFAAPSGQAPRDASSTNSAKPNAGATAEGSKAKPPANKNGQREQGSSGAQPKSQDSMRHQALSREGKVEIVRPAQHLLAERRMTANSGKGLRKPMQMQPASDQKGKPGLIAASNLGRAPRSFRAIQPNTQLLGTVAHRGANPPAISGAATARHVDTAALNGALVRRKP